MFPKREIRVSGWILTVCLATLGVACDNSDNTNGAGPGSLGSGNGQGGQGTGAGSSSCLAAADPTESSCGTASTYNSHGCSSCSTVGSCKSGDVTIMDGSYYCGDTPGTLSLCKKGTLVDIIDCQTDCKWYGAGTGTYYSTSCWDEDSTTVDSKKLKLTDGPGCYYGYDQQCSP
jgi:hypothetical protein